MNESENKQTTDPLLPVVNHSQNITVEKIKKFLPKGCGARATEEIANEINNVSLNTDIDQNYFEEKLMGSMHILGKQGATIEQLVNAVKYCCLKNSPGVTNEQAWAIVFPDRYDKLVNENRFIASHVSGYNNSDMVVEIDKKMMVPAYVTYQPYFHAAVKKQFDLMNGIASGTDQKVSAHVQHLAAKELREITQMPEDSTINLKVGMDKESKSVYAEMTNQLALIARQQKLDLESGKNILDVQKLNINMDEILDAQLVEENS